MTRISALAGLPVVSVDGVVLGSVREALFHPSNPFVLGLSVARPRAAKVFAREDRYVARTSVRIEKERVVLSAKRLPTIDKSERAIGVSWDDTVQWRGMPVAVASSEVVGTVADVVVDWETGSVAALEVVSGAIGAAAVGRLVAAGEMVTGFRDGAVQLSCTYADLKATGGAAKAAAAGAVAIKETAAAAAKGAYDAGKSAAIAVGRSMKHGTGRRVLDALKKAAREAMREDE